MSLPKTNLDDKNFFRIVEEARALIPSRAPEWTDHNIHDPGITFIELFSWLAEIHHYRLNHVSAESFRRFFDLVGLIPNKRRPAEVSIALNFQQATAAFIPAYTRVDPTSIEDLPFETVDDCFLTPAHVVEVITRAGDREVRQTLAQQDSSGHYAVFGTSPAIGNSLELGFDKPFSEQESRLSITLFEDDLPTRVHLTPGERGFVPSATVTWAFYTGTGWEPLTLMGDTTLHLSSSGDLTFKAPDSAAQKDGKYWLRGTLTAGSYEIPPRIDRVLTNFIRARQVETIVNEDLGKGLGTPDQTVLLKKAPVLLGDLSAGSFLAGEIIDWRALIFRLAKPDTTLPRTQAELVRYVVSKLGDEAVSVLRNAAITRPADGDFAKLQESAKYPVANAFKELLENPKFYDRKVFAEFSVPQEFAELAAGRSADCVKIETIRKFNRLLLRCVFPDLLRSDRVEIQTGMPVANVEDEGKSWASWTPVVDFTRSSPNDRHYVLDPELGEIRFGNGLNGRKPETTEFIRARFYRYTRAEGGNIPALYTWLLFLPTEELKRLPSPSALVGGTNLSPAEGGAPAESIDDAKFRSRQVFRTQQRAVTAEDYESQALKTPGLRVARTKAIPNHNPNVPKIPFPGDVTVVVVPAPGAGGIIPAVEPPSPSEGFRTTVRNYLNSRRTVGTNVHVVGPEWVKVQVSARVFLKKGVDEKDVRQQLKLSLDRFLDPFKGGPEPGKGWPFGRAVFPSEIYQLLGKIPGVEYVTEVALNDNAADQPLRLHSTALPYPGIHEKLQTVRFELRGQAMTPLTCEKGGHCLA